MGAGLGGGSSDAATVLVALNVLWGLNLPENELVALGLRLGADVPIFVRGKSAWAEGIGEKLSPFSPEVGPIFVIIPNCEVPTQEIFNDPLLTRDTDAIKMHEFSMASSRNDCELVTRRLYPRVGDALDWLGHYRPSRMSGTGSSVFALFECREELEVVGHALPSEWIGFPAERENHSPLLKRIDEESDGLKG
jgi:4-diphosphocytidyl-2-C-methyl-D-erythritol kinase